MQYFTRFTESHRWSHHYMAQIRLCLVTGQTSRTYGKSVCRLGCIVTEWEPLQSNLSCVSPPICHLSRVGHVVLTNLNHTSTNSLRCHGITSPLHRTLLPNRDIEKQKASHPSPRSVCVANPMQRPSCVLQYSTITWLLLQYRPCCQLKDHNGSARTI